MSHPAVLIASPPQSLKEEKVLLTACRYLITRIKVLKYQYVIFGLLAHVIESLRRRMLQIHRRPHVMPTDVVCFNQRGAGYAAAITDG